MKMTKTEILVVSITALILAILVCYCIFSTKETGKEEKTTEEITTEETTTEEVTTEGVVTTTTKQEKITTTEVITTEEEVTEETTTEEVIYTEQNTTAFVEVSEPETTEEIATNTDAEETSMETEDVVTADIPWIVYEVVECEVHGGDKESKMHVAHVIRNRVWSDLFPNDYYSVCTSPNQFCWRSDVEQSTIDAVNEAMQIEDTTYGALFFHSMDWMSSWGGYEWKFTDNVGHHFY